MRHVLMPPTKIWTHPRSVVLPSSPDYVELQVTSNFSFLRGASFPEEFVERAKQLGYRAIAIADLHSVAGAVRAHVVAKELQMPLIVGAQIAPYADISTRALLPFSLFVYPTDRAAYGRLCQLLTAGKLRAPKGQCYLAREDLLSHQEGMLITVSISDWRQPALLPTLRQLKEGIDGDRLSLAIANTYGADRPRRIRILQEIARELSLPLLATNDALFHSPERRALQDVLTCIRRGCTIGEAGFSLHPNGERYLKSPQEMYRLCPPRAIRRALEVAERVQFSLDEVRYEYPREICPPGRTPAQYLRELTEEGARERYPQGIPEEVCRQIEHELSLIGELGYERYFLTVCDIVRFARGKGILCQGRGAAANSAVCYALGITAVDPDRIDLLFERFISRERDEPPDIDIDFEHERREEVLQYVYRKYGRHRAALIAEVITYRTRSAFRDVGKVLGLSLDTVESLIRVATRADGAQCTDGDLRRAGIDPDDRAIRHTLQLTSALIGFPRHLSQHVGGMIISETPLSTFVPVENAAMPGRTVVEWDKDDIDRLGMLKIDLLALGMLTCIRKAFALVNEGDPGRLSAEMLMLHTIPAEDATVYDMIDEADTVGVFQIESRAQMSMLPRLKPRCFYDLVIEVAIVRPGPIQGGMVHPYLRRRSGKEKPHYPNEQIERILGRTLGVPIFQEQAMELAVVAAGFTRGEADTLRRAMANWKRNKNLEHFADRIVTGMVRNGYSRAFAVRCFEQIRGFGDYGFPQSHAASFALLVYVSAWLKRHHPAVFAAALINSQPMGFYQPAQIVQDAARHGVSILTIDVNASDWNCTLEGGALRLGLRLVRGLEHSEALLLRQGVVRNGPFQSLVRLWRESGVRLSTLRTLARADAFQSLELTRQQALWEIRKLRDDPLPLFDGLVEKPEGCPLPSPSPSAEMVRDYHTTGLSLKAHPLTFLRAYLNGEGALPASALLDERLAPAGRTVLVAGLVLVRQRPAAARGTVFMTLEDETGIVNLIIHSDIFRRYRDILCDSVIVSVHGKLQREGRVVHVVVEEARTSGRAATEIPGMSRDFH